VFSWHTVRVYSVLNKGLQLRIIHSVQTCLCHRLKVIGIVVSFLAGKHLLVILRRIRGTEIGQLGSQESKAKLPEYERMFTDALPHSVILRYWPIHPERNTSRAHLLVLRFGRIFPALHVVGMRIWNNFIFNTKSIE